MLEASSIIVLVAGLVAFMVGAYHFVMMLDNFKQEKRLYVHLLAPIAIFLSGWLNSDGIYHRSRMAVFFAVFALSGLLFAVLRPMW